MKFNTTRRRFLSQLGGGLVVGSIASQTATAQSTDPSDDWPSAQYDHLNSGYNPGIEGLDREQGESLERVWSPPVKINQGHMFPVVSDGRVFSGGGPDGESLLAFDKGDGTEEWRFYMGSGLKVSPTAGPHAVYALDESGTLHAVNKKTGDKKWTRSIGPESGNYAAPVIKDGSIFVTATETHPHKGIVSAYSQGGEINWQEEIEFDSDGPYYGYPPTVYGNLVFVAFSDEGLVVIDTSGESNKTGKVPVNGEDVHVTSPVVKDDVAYLSTGGVITAAPIPGNDSDEGWRFSVAGTVRTPVAITEDKIIAYSDNGTIYALNYDGDRQWETSIKAPFINIFLTVVEGTIYVTPQNYIFAINLSDGSIRWKFEADYSLRGSAIPSGEGFYTQDGKFAPVVETTTNRKTEKKISSTAQSQDTEDDELKSATTESSAPGFGMGAGLTALLGTTEIIRRSRSSED